MKGQEREVVSLNEELLSLDLDDVSVEMLEQRLDLAAIFLNDCVNFACPDYDGWPVCPSNTHRCDAY